MLKPTTWRVWRVSSSAEPVFVYLTGVVISDAGNFVGKIKLHDLVAAAVSGVLHFHRYFDRAGRLLYRRRYLQIRILERGVAQAVAKRIERTVDHRPPLLGIQILLRTCDPRFYETLGIQVQLETELSTLDPAREALMQYLTRGQ